MKRTIRREIGLLLMTGATLWLIIPQRTRNQTESERTVSYLEKATNAIAQSLIRKVGLVEREPVFSCSQPDGLYQLVVEGL